LRLAPERDEELLDGFQRCESMLMDILTPEQMDEYAEAIRWTGEIRILEDLTPAEVAALTPEMRAIAETIIADLNVSMENRRVVALLNQRGEHVLAPDLAHSR
jgi:hypothetical protein